MPNEAPVKPHSESAKTLALAEAFDVLVRSLHDDGSISAASFFSHATVTGLRLAAHGETEAAEAFQDLMRPLAVHMDFGLEVSG